jgi:zinc D-Ala-D-Ala dipeptidase
MRKIQINIPILTAAIILALSAAAAPQKLPPGFVYLRDVDASIGQDIRYATDVNFTGRPLPGYSAPECVLRRDVALALRAVQTDLAKQNLSLKAYDCYRPARAVRTMWRWAHDGTRDGDKSFYPRVRKFELFSLGYIAAHSAHSSGTAVDLTLVVRNAAQAPVIEPRTTYAPCTAPAAQRAGDNSIDMGTGFDCLDEKSHTVSGSITPDQKRARGLLNAVMRAHGFHNYFREWWHFSFGARPAREYDFQIEAR